MTNSNRYLEYDLAGHVNMRFFIKNGLIYWDGREIGICLLRDIIYRKTRWEFTIVTEVFHNDCYWLILE